MIGVENAGFVLASTVKVCFVIETDKQVTLGSAIEGKCIHIPKTNAVNATRSAGQPTNTFTVEVSRVLFKRTASA